MRIGELLADRFRVLRLVGRGGMGAVYAAEDLAGGGQVALKLVDGAEAARFTREAAVLAELRHPVIVRYVTHGATHDGQPYLAMEWLEGEDLHARLDRGALDAADAIAIVRRAAEGLAFAHARGVVHRDVKPSNLFLVGGDAARAKVLDFGIARTAARSRVLTRTGALMGTLGYMAPEQVQGAADVGPAADVFGLGCVLYECLTGAQAFPGEHLLAVLAKLLHDEPPRPSDSRPGVGEELDELVARMLAKDPGARPRDGAALVEALDRLGATPLTVASPKPRPPRSSSGERRLASVLLCELAPRTSDGPHPARDDHRIARTAQRFEADMAWLGEDNFVFTWPGRGAASDQASRLASCALALAPLLPGGRIAGAIGLGQSSTGHSGLLAGPVIDRAARLLGSAASSRAGALGATDASLSLGAPTGSHEGPTGEPGPPSDRTEVSQPGAHGEDTGAEAGGRALHELPTLPPPRPATAVVDEVTAGLLDARFEVEDLGGHVFTLVAERDVVEAPRLLLGKRTPCVGRDKELTLLESTFREVVDDEVARVVLVTGPPGIGKSRLRSELRARLGPDARVLVARADPMAAGSALGVAAALIRAAARIDDPSATAAPGGRAAALQRYLEAVVPADALALTAAVLGEILGLRAADPPPELRAARNDAAVMREQQRRALLAWIRGECADPLCIVLEDLHWGDAATVAFLDEALGLLHERPLFVVAFARPEVHDLFGQLFARAHPLELELAPLPRKAAERLARAALGDRVDPDIMKRIVERAAGNAFYLEELVRCVADGRIAELPGTVLAMAQSRLERLAPEARRVLRLASVFGESFWPGGLAAVLGGEQALEWLDVLVDNEIVAPAPRSRFASERELVFRHALLRDAAYALSTPEEVALAHAAAGDWLERVGETDARILAEHFERGGERKRALTHLVRAARLAVDAGDYDGAETLVSRAVAAGAAGEALGTVLIMRGFCAAWRGDWSTVIDAAGPALDLLPSSDALWWAGVSGLMYGGLSANREEVTASAGMRAFTAAPPSEPSGPYGLAAQSIVVAMLITGQEQMAAAFLGNLEALAEARPDGDPTFRGWLRICRANLETSALGDIGRAERCAHEALEVMTAAGQPTGISMAQMCRGVAMLESGRLERAGADLDVAAESARRAKLAHALRYIELFRYSLRMRAADLDDATLACDPDLYACSDIVVAGHARGLHAEGLLHLGRFAEAEAEARALLDDRRFAAVFAQPAWLVGTLELGRGNGAEALALATRALEQPSSYGLFTRTRLELLRSEALDALGERERALPVVRASCARLAATARGLSPEARATYLENLEPVARMLARGRAWLGADPLAPSDSAATPHDIVATS